MHHAHRIAAALAAAVLSTAVAGILLVAPVAPVALAAPAQAEPELLSQGRPVVASSQEKAAHSARHAVDGDPDTRWSSAYEDPQWIRVDLGRSTVVHRVEIEWEAAYSTAYSIQLSTDGETWKTHWSGAGDGGQDVHAIHGEGRYVRVHSTARNGAGGHSIWELRVFGEPIPEKEPVKTEAPEPPPETAAPPSSTPTAEPTPAPSKTERPVPERTGPPGSVPYYVVGKQPDGKVEKLNDIAERFLGDRERWTQVAELNEAHRQPDGGYLTDPRTLRPGWVLQLPKDATGVGLKFGPLPGYEEVSASPSAASPAPAEPAPEPVNVAQRDQAPSAGSIAAVASVAAAVLGLVLLVFLGAWLVRRRKRREPFDDSLLRVDTSAAWTVDRSLRALIAACERDGLEVPAITGVFIEGSSVRLRLTNPAAPAPEPWAVSEDGQSWAAPLAKLQAAVASEESTARFSRLVNLGMAETGRVLVDFSVAKGVISLDGPTRARHEVLRRWLGELTGNPWSDDPRVVLVGNGLPQPEQVEHLAGIEQVVPELEVGEGGVLVLSQAPSAAQQEMLAARFASPEFTWVVIVLGPAPSARWRFTAADDGWLRSGFLPDVRYDEQTAVRRGGE